MNNKLTTFSLVMAMLLTFSFKTDQTGYEPGATASTFNLKNTDGKMLNPFESMKTKGYIVIFTCNHCPFAKAYEDRIIQLDKNFKSKGYPVIAINSNDSASYPEDSYDEMVKRSKSKKYSFPYLYDQSQEVAKAYGALKTPHVYLLHMEGGVPIVKYTGAIDDNSDDAKKVKEKYLENALNELIAGKEVTVKTTKAIGCGIKWKK
ncbi:MAG TPA: thioredoxin family protein [Bacteroidia bacterium]